MRDHIGAILLSKNLIFAKGITLVDDMEGALVWSLSGTGADPTLTQQNAASYTGTYGLRLKTRVTNPAGGDTATAYRLFSKPQSGVLVMRARIACSGWNLVDALTMAIDVYNASRQYTGAIVYTNATPRGEYLDAAGAPVSIPTFGLALDNMAWLDMSLCVATSELTYQWAEFAGVRASLADIPLQDKAASTLTQVSVSISLTSLGAASAQMYIDNVSVTEYPEL